MRQAGDRGDNSVENSLAGRRTSCDDQGQQLLIFDHQRQRGEGSRQPATETVADDAAGKVLILFDTFKVGPHAIGAPRRVVGQISNVLPIAVVSGDCDQSIMPGAASECASPGIPHPKGCCIRRRVKPDIEAAIRHLVCHLGVPLLAFEIRVVLDKVIPPRILEFGRE